MAIRRLIVNNYRSIEALDIELQAVNAFIGPNNSGKSNVLRALDLVLGDTWPSKPFSDRDFFGHDTAQTIEITVLFGASLAADNAVHGFQLTYSTANGVDYCAVDDIGAPVVGYRGANKRVSNAMREEAALLYLELDRRAEKQLRPSVWTLYGKLLRAVEQTVTNADRGAFVTDVNTSLGRNIQAYLDPVQTTISDLVQQQTGLTVQLNFRALDPLEALKGVRPFVVDHPVNCDAEEVGAGVQSAIAVAVAKAYADIARVPVTLAIEEPELFLHPHGSRHFYRLLKTMASGGLQVIYATHERSFVSAADYEAIHIVRKTGGRTTVTSGNTMALTGRAVLNLQSKFNERLNEVFFASAAVLVEGDADEIACKAAFEAIGVATDRDGISILGLGGISEIAPVAEMLVAFGIPTVAIVDEDPGNASTARANARITANLTAANVFQQRPDLETLFGLVGKPDRVAAMTAFPAYFGANAVQQVYQDAAARVAAIKL